MPTSGDAGSEGQTACTSENLALLRKTSRNVALWRAMDLNAHAFCSTIAHDHTDNNTRMSRTPLLTGPVLLISSTRSLPAKGTAPSCACSARMRVPSVYNETSEGRWRAAGKAQTQAA